MKYPQVSKIMTVFSLCLALTGTLAQAESQLIQNLKGTEAESRISSYLENGDGSCKGCEGNNREWAVEKLQLVHETSELQSEIASDDSENDGQYYLVAKLWANSWHRMPYDPNNFLNQLARTACGAPVPENDKFTVYGGPHCRYQRNDINSFDRSKMDCGLLEKEFKIPLTWDDEQNQWVADLSVQQEEAKHIGGIWKVRMESGKIFDRVKDFLVSLN